MHDVLYLSVKDVNIRVLANEIILFSIKKNENNLRAIIPELNIKNYIESDIYYYTIELKEASKSNLLVKNNLLVYEYDAEQFDLISFVYTLLTNVLSQLLFERNKLFIHSSVFDFEGAGYALFGRGKTSSILSLGKNNQLKIIAEDNAILDLDDFTVSGELVSFNMFENGGKKRVFQENINVTTSSITNLKMIISLSNQYEDEGISRLKGFEKSSIICSFVNERLFNHSRWNENLKIVPDFRVIKDLETKRDGLISNMMDNIEVTRIESSIKNYPNLINKLIGL